MKRFRQWLIENRFATIIHHDDSPNKDKISNIIKAHHIFGARFVIDEHNKFHLGSALNFVHTDLYPEGQRVHKGDIHGFVDNTNGKDGSKGLSYTAYHPNQENEKLSSEAHPHLKKLETQGINNANEET